MKPLRALLEDYNSTTLAVIISKRGLPVRAGQSKAANINSLVALFTNETVLRAVIESLSPAERLVVDDLQPTGRASLSMLASRLKSRNLIEPLTDQQLAYGSLPKPDASHSRRVDEIMAHLLLLGVVFALLESSPRAGAGSLLDFSLAEEYVIPEEIRRFLPPPLPEPEGTRVETPVVSVVRSEAGSARTFQRDVFLYWSFVYEKPVSLLARGMLPKRSLSTLNETLLVRSKIETGDKESDFPRLVFLRALMLKLGLLKQKGEELLEAVHEPVYLTMEPAARLQRCYESYTSSGFYNELAWYPELKISSQAAPRLPAHSLVINARRTLLSMLGTYPDWCLLADFTNRVRSDAYEFLFRRGFKGKNYYYGYGLPRHPYSMYTNPLGWEFTDLVAKPSSFAEEHGWDQVEGGFIHQVITGPLHWMGLVDLGYSQPGLEEPDAFRLSVVGQWLLAGGAQPEIPVEGGRVLVQPNFQVMAFDPVSDVVLMNLGRFAERLAAERVAEFRLTRLSIYNAQKQGWDVPAIRAYLEKVSGSPLPENVSRTLDEWQELHERITIHRGVSLLHAVSSAQLDTLYADPAMQKYLGARLEPHLAQISGRSGRSGSKAISRLVQSLLQGERIPLVRSKESRLPPGSVLVQEDGSLSFALAAPDLYLHGHLRRFAEANAGGYLITPDSVRRAKRSGLEAPEILQALQAVAAGPLPERLVQHIRAWSGHYGEATFEEVTLLHLQGEQVLAELLDDPEIGPLLQPFRQRGAHNTARVRSKDLERLRKLLVDRGIELK